MDQNDDGLKGERPEVTAALRSMNWEDRLAKARAQRQAVLAQKKAAPPPTAAEIATRAEPVLPRRRPTEGSPETAPSPEERLVRPVQTAAPPAAADDLKEAAIRSLKSEHVPPQSEKTDRPRVVPAPQAKESRPTRVVDDARAIPPRRMGRRVAVRTALGFGVGLGIGTSLLLGMWLLSPQAPNEPASAPAEVAATPPAPVTAPSAAPEALAPEVATAPAASVPDPAEALPPIAAGLTAPAQDQLALMVAEESPVVFLQVPLRPFLAPVPVFPRLVSRADALPAITAPPAEPSAVALQSEVAAATAPPSQDDADVLLSEASEALAPARSAPPRPRPGAAEGAIAEASLAPPEALVSPLPEAAPAALPEAPVAAAPDAPAATPGAIPGASALTVFVHAPPTVADSALAEASGTIEGAGAALGAARRVTFTVSETHLRYFHEADRAAAVALADLIGARARDFTAFRPSPPDGAIEVYLSGTGVPTVARSTPRTSAPVDEATRLRNRIIRSLRQGEFLE